MLSLKSTFFFDYFPKLLVMKKIFFLRHGHSTLTGKYVGSTDCPLSAKGKQQVATLAKNNLFAEVPHVISSPMLRCVQTYQGLGLKAKVEHEESLREINFGLWEGLEFDQVYSLYRDEFDTWCTAPQDFRFPGGESIKEFEARLAQMPKYLKNFGGDLLIIAHGGVIRHLICSLIGIPSELAMKFQIDVAHYAIVDIFGDDCVLNALNHG